MLAGFGVGQACMCAPCGVVLVWALGAWLCQGSSVCEGLGLGLRQVRAAAGRWPPSQGCLRVFDRGCCGMQL